MKLICAFCGRRNSGTATVCAQCGGSLVEAGRAEFQWPWASWLGALIAITFLWSEANSFARTRQKTLLYFKDEIRRVGLADKQALVQLENDHRQREELEEAKHRKRLNDPKLISGELASSKHAEEWRRRQNHDPAFASTILEKTLLQVEKLGKDPSLAAEQALREVARMVAPQGSRIEITPSGNRFVVRVAFRLGAVMPQEEGGSTRHTSSAEMRMEIQEVCARMVQSLFDYCGSRGIERLSVSCNRAIATSAIMDDEPDKLVMRSVYRASVDAATASGVNSWRHLSLPEVVELLKTDRDVISTITITYTLRPAVAVDPDAPLEF